MAYRLKASWHVHHVHIGTSSLMSADVKEYLANLEQLTVRLGVIFTSINVQVAGSAGYFGCKG